MSILPSREISVSAAEGRNKVANKRSIEGFRLELSNAIPNQTISGRTDWFEGVEYILSIDQAERLARDLSENIKFIRQLESEGKIIILAPER